jgi:hypothetical protein
MPEKFPAGQFLRKPTNALVSVYLNSPWSTCTEGCGSGSGRIGINLADPDRHRGSEAGSVSISTNLALLVN